jgi:hypothetical protein
MVAVSTDKAEMRPTPRVRGSWLLVLAFIGGCAHGGGDTATGDLSDSGALGPTEASTSGSGPTVDDDSSTPPERVVPTDGTDDVAASADAPAEAANDDAALPGEASTVDGAATHDAGPDVEASSELDAGAPDATLVMVEAGGETPGPTCAQICTSGCCNTDGQCLEGAADEACGRGGATCQDCASAGQTCQSKACQAPPAPPPPTPTTPPPPPAPTTPPPPPPPAPTCDVSSCTNLCIPYFVQCCKADQTCGCALFFPRGSCN